MRVVAINGSPRLNGYTNRIIDYVFMELENRGIQTERILLNQHKIGFCQAHDDCRSNTECLQKDDVGWILEKYCQADGIILASPVYFGTVSGQMKTFLDRSNFLFLHNIMLKARCAGLIAVAGQRGTDETIEALKFFIRHNDLKVFTIQENVGLPGAESPNWPNIVEKAQNMGKQMADVLGINH